jgi:hypothetical protein
MIRLESSDSDCPMGRISGERVLIRPILCGTPCRGNSSKGSNSGSTNEFVLAGQTLFQIAGGSIGLAVGGLFVSLLFVGEKAVQHKSTA